jgi:hypothetical protein
MLWSLHEDPESQKVRLVRTKTTTSINGTNGTPQNKREEPVRQTWLIF